MKNTDKFNEIINDSINKLSKGLSNNVDAYLMADLKRMAELGVLEVHTSQPDFKEIHSVEQFSKTIEASVNVRLYFKGEDTILKLKKDLEQSKERELELTAAMQWFVNRCDNGEVRSKKTYERFKELLNK